MIVKCSNGILRVYLEETTQLIYHIQKSFAIVCCFFVFDIDLFGRKNINSHSCSMVAAVLR
jgi:hypothetical protein